MRLDVPAELSQMKIRDAGALRKKSSWCPAEAWCFSFFTMFYHDLPTSCDSWDGHTLATCDRLKVRPNAIRRCCTATPGIILSRSDLLSHNLDPIQSHVHTHRSTYVVNVRVHPSISIHRCTKSQPFKGGICRDLPRWWVSAYPWSHRNVHGCCDCGDTPSSGDVFGMHLWVSCFGMYHVHVHQVSIRSWKSSPKYLHTEAKKVFAWLVSCKWCFLAEFEECLQLHENQLTILLF